MPESQGKINRYTCSVCGWTIVTRNHDEGVTPFMLPCNRAGDRRRNLCTGQATSAFYQVDQSLTPTHEWFRPDDQVIRSLSPNLRYHVQQGGLLLRPVVVDGEEVRHA